MDGISIGKVIRMVIIYLNLILVLLIAQASAYAKTIDMAVAANVDVNEFNKDV